MKFCFFGDISNALKGRTQGGAELQIALIAKALALNGHEIVIVDPYSAGSFVTEDGIRIINIPEWNKGIKGIRFFLHRIPAINKIFKEQNADYYYARMRTYFHLLSYMAAKKLKKKFILAIAHDSDILSMRNKLRYFYSKGFNLFKYLTLNLPNDFVFNYLLKKADYIILQHSGQKLFQNSVKGKIVIFPNIFDFSNIPVINNPSKSYFIHAGTLTILKGVDNLYRLIKEIDKKNSILIVGQPGDKHSKKKLNRLRKFENIVMTGKLSHAETINLIANAKALINTSFYEGFPNIFLESWATGIPVISLNINPGYVFDKYDLGIYCNGDLNKMIKSIELDETRNIDKRKLISYVEMYHNFDTAADRFLNILINA